MSNQYVKELIKQYRNRLERESNSFMSNVLETAVKRLQMGDNPHLVKDWVIKIEKQYRPKSPIPTMSRMAIAIIQIQIKKPQ